MVSSDRTRGIYILSYAPFWLLLVLAITLEYVPVSPLKPDLPLNVRSAFRQVLPEGWGFFTKSQRDEDFQLYRVPEKGQGYSVAFDGPESEPRYLVGVSRLPRAEGLEVGMMMNAASDHLKTCTGALTECLRGASTRPAVALPTSSEMPALLCGDFVIAMQAPIPFAWTQFKNVTRPGRFAHIFISCMRKTS